MEFSYRSPHSSSQYNETTLAFGQPQIDYLGHVVSKDGVWVDTSKIEAIQKWPTPTSLKQLKGFLSLVSYYRKFINGFAKLATPLTDLLKKDAFLWLEKSQQAFLALKSALTQAPVLALIDFSRPFILETNASGSGIALF